MADLSQDAIEARAAQLFARSLDETLSPEERAEIEAWRYADPRHAVAFARLDRAWAASARLKAVLKGDARRWPWSARAAVLAAAGIVMALAGALTIPVLIAKPVAVAQTAIGERRSITLADGSRVDLNTQTKLEVGYTSAVRLVTLSEGEALFQVAKDASRPFIVRAAHAEVRAVGTSFVVRMHADAVGVSVIEGLVKVSEQRRGEGGGANAREFAQGASAMVANGLIAEIPVSSDVLKRRTAWTHGVIELNGETVSEAVAEFNRYGPDRIIVIDPALARTRLAGRFQVNEQAKFVHALAAGFNARAMRGADGAIYLTRADAAAAP